MRDWLRAPSDQCLEADYCLDKMFGVYRGMSPIHTFPGSWVTWNLDYVCRKLCVRCKGAVREGFTNWCQNEWANLPVTFDLFPWEALKRRDE